MLISDIMRQVFGVVVPLCLVTLLGATAARALDGTPTDATDPSPIEMFKRGAKALKAGDIAAGSAALEFAAGKGHAMSQWKLARMYADGEGVPRDDFKAFEFYEQIANTHADEAPDTQQARFVASAFVALGSYYLKGIPSSPVAPDPQRAADLFHYAASYFGDPDAQYNLGRMYLAGAPGFDADPKSAARWLRLSADKDQKAAQALLGHMLFAGEVVPRQAAKGLMYLELARGSAAGPEDDWIVDLYDRAFAAASDDERSMATAYADKFRNELR